jgi:hypothetical protein
MSVMGHGVLVDGSMVEKSLTPSGRIMAGLSIAINSSLG